MKKNFDMIYWLFVFFKGNCCLTEIFPFFFFFCFQVDAVNGSSHWTEDKECPFFIKGNQKLEQFRVVSRAPQYQFTYIRDSEYQWIRL